MNRLKLIILVLGFFTLVAALALYSNAWNFRDQKAPRNDNPTLNGYVNDEITAIKIAEAVWLPIYGESIYEKRPFKAHLQDTVWIVTGTLHTTLGGTPYLMISKKDGRILRVTHGL